MICSPLAYTFRHCYCIDQPIRDVFFIFPHQVAWRRASEPNPLSIGTTPFTEKHRVRVQHRGQLWTIYIGNVQPADSGVYECQISSKENLRKLFMLRVNGRYIYIYPRRKLV